MELYRKWMIGAAFIAVVVSVLGYRLRRPQRNAARARTIGRRGEAIARRMLERDGYRIVQEQPAGVVDSLLDGQPVRHHVRADFLVERDGRFAIADAKAGDMATRPSRAATRRQLLEYTRAYDVDEVLLVDTEADAIRHIRFPAKASPRYRFRWLIVGATLGSGATFGLLRVLFR